MPSERSLYHKIGLVVEAASRSRSAGEALQSYLVKLPAFESRQYDKKRDKFVGKESPKAVHRVVRLCMKLGLLDAAGELTRLGQRATAKPKFDETVADCVSALLGQAGVELSAMNRLIRQSIRSEPPKLPTAKVIWTELSPNTSRGEFGRLLTLLVHCGAATASQQRIFLSMGRHKS